MSNAPRSNRPGEKSFGRDIFCAPVLGIRYDRDMADTSWKQDPEFLRLRRHFLQLLQTTPDVTRAFVVEKFSSEELADQLIERCHAEMEIDRQGDVITLTKRGETYLDNLETGRG